MSTQELKKALHSLQEALALPKTAITRDASIQRFEYTLELAWKTAKKKMGSASAAPKVVVREMAAQGLIPDPGRWVDYLDARNLTTHAYNEEIAEKVYEAADAFALECADLIPKLDLL